MYGYGRVRFARQQWRARIETTGAGGVLRFPRDSPASNGGRGLKLQQKLVVVRNRMDSPASNGGRGLKLLMPRSNREMKRFARQQWRARIETT